MKKISNEVKVGAVALVTIFVFIWLFNFLKGKEYFSSTANYYCIYNEIGGLAESSPVEINGYKVGVVQSIDFLDDLSGKLLVVFSVSKDFRLPVNTVAEIVPVSIIAGMKVQFVYGEGPGTYSDGDTIPGLLSPSLMTTLEAELAPVKTRIIDLLDVLDSTISSVNEILTPEFSRDMKATLANLENTSESVSNIIGSGEKDLKEAIGNFSRFSAMLGENSDKMGSTISNFEAISDTLASSDLYNSVAGLKASLEQTALLFENLNDGKGSAGKMMTDDSLYTNLTLSLENLNELLKDMKENPKRYVHFSLFGKK